MLDRDRSSTRASNDGLTELGGRVERVLSVEEAVLQQLCRCGAFAGVLAQALVDQVPEGLLP